MLKIEGKVKYNDLNTVNDFGKNDITQKVQGILPVSVVSAFKPDSHERRSWRIIEGNEYFGLYTKDKWNEFLKSIKLHGVKNAIMIYIEKDGSITIGEGSHRIEACLQTNTEHIPVDIRYFGCSETHVDFFNKFITG